MHQREAKILGRIFHAIEILRDLPFRRDHHDRRRVRKLLGVFVPRILETDCFRQRLDGRLLSRQKMPALISARTPVTRDHRPLLCGRKRRPFSRIKAHGDHFVVLANVELQSREDARHAVHHFAAEHGALVINHAENHWPFAEVVAQLHQLSGVITENQVERELLIQLLFNPDALQDAWRGLCCTARRRSRHSLSVRECSR